MTVIAWDGKTLAADKQTTDAGLRRTTTKLRRAKSGELLASTGASGMCRELMDWWEAGAQKSDFPDKEDKCHLVVVRQDRTVVFYSGSPAPIHTEERFTAFGSGRDYAIAAMHLGRSAREAVELACLYESSCGSGIDTLELE
jgi:hypothetical protein